MPPRYSYWTIIAGGLPTAFRAAEREELMPTFTRLREKHPDAEMRWFARGKLWDSPEAARQELDERRTGGRDGDARPRRKPEGRSSSSRDAVRDRSWRPGGQHRDPRQPYVDAKKARNLERRKQKFARKQRDGGSSRFEGPEQDPQARPEHHQRPGAPERRPGAHEGGRHDRRDPRGGPKAGSWNKQVQQRPWKGGGEQARGAERRPPNRPWSPRPESDRSRSSDDAEGGRPQRPAGPAGDRERPKPFGRNTRGGRPLRPGGPADSRQRPQEARWSPGGKQGERQHRPAGPAGYREPERQRPSNRSNSERPQKTGWRPRGDADRPSPRTTGARENRDRNARKERDRDTRGTRDARRDEDRNKGSAYKSRPKGPRGERGAPHGGRPRWDDRAAGKTQERPAGPRGQARGSAETGREQHEPPKRRFEPPSFSRNQGTEEPAAPPRPRGPNREPHPSESPEPTPPPRPSEPEIPAPGPPERGRLVKTRRRS